MKNLLIVAVAISLMTSCDYYEGAMEYKDFFALEAVSNSDRFINNQETPIVLEFRDRCFLKKGDVWVLLNGKSSDIIKTMSGDLTPCITDSELKWVKLICPSITDNDQTRLERNMLCK